MARRRKSVRAKHRRKSELSKDANIRDGSDVEEIVSMLAESQDSESIWKAGVDGVMSDPSPVHEATSRGRSRGGDSSRLNSPAKTRQSNPVESRVRAGSGKRGGRRYRSVFARVLRRLRRGDQPEGEDKDEGVVIGFGRRVRMTASRKRRHLVALLARLAAVHDKRIGKKNER